MAARAAALAKEIEERRGKRGAKKRPANKEHKGEAHADEPERAEATPQPAKERLLVDPLTLVVANPDRESSNGSAKKKRPDQPRRPEMLLPEPDRNARPPRNKSAAPRFTALDKETVGLELTRLIFSSDDEDMADLRAQRRVGADAIDDLNRFFELKVHLGDEPDTIRLEETQIRRALETPNFFLVVVSNVEGINARPKVRIIVDPVHQLSMTESSSVTFTGVRSAEHSLVYNLEPISDKEEPSSDEENDEETRTTGAD
jgi:hypothetical protein